MWTAARIASAGLLSTAAVAMGVTAVYGVTVPTVGSPFPVATDSLRPVAGSLRPG